MISTPDDLPFFGHEKDINYYAYLGTYNNSDKLSFLYTPPGASNLPSANYFNTRKIIENEKTT